MQSGPGSPSVSVSSPTGSRLRKKHKRLDAICEHLYNQNHRESIESKGDTELRRSSRLRRPPVMLDVSPRPAKRRRQIDKKLNLKSLRSYVKDKEETDVAAPESWRSRLRSSGKRKLFDDVAGKEEELDDQDLMVVKLKRQGSLEVVDGFGNGDIECEDTMHDLKNECEEDLHCVGSEVVRGNAGETLDGDASPSRLEESEEKRKLDDMELQKTDDGNHCGDKVEQLDNGILEEPRTGMDENNGSHSIDVSLSNKVEDGGNGDGDEGVSVKVNEISLEAPEDAEMDGHDSANKLGGSRIKQGRRCGLCGCSNDGKPPKRLVEDFGDSGNEVYGGSSDSEDANYDIWDGFGDEPGWLGRLLGPINDRYGIAGIWVHQHCAVWSPEVYFAGLGCLKNVRAALCRGRALKCSRCGRPGATIGCRVDRCPKTYHLPCARASSCIFDHRKFLIACTDHRHLFQPHGNQLVMQMKKLKAKKMRLDMRKLSNDAWRKDVEAEERWLENCGEDEEFLKRESKRLHRDMLRIAPEYIGGSDSEHGKLFEGWESVAGLQDVIQCMKEVVFLPLLYPELFNNLGITPPRGVLLHGYPGTGKTLVVRALIGSCARGDKRIAYFARKGADCLGKYVGDAERQLRLLFQVAERSQPSIIFFDEIDGLAPCRTRQQDQTHSSVVSTLLALMDGLKSRGSVVVIGATNRPEAVDPALRRPGRFDREIYFPLPSAKDRAAIISLHTRRWPKPVSGSLLKWIATRTAGFAGADLQALCTQAAIIALKRDFTLQQILSGAREKPLATKRSSFAFMVEDRDWLKALACAPLPCSRREAGMAAYDVASSPLAAHLIPCLLRPLTILLVSLHLHEQLWLPPSLLKAASAVKNVIMSSLEKNNLPCDHWWSHVDNFLKDAEIAKVMQTRLKSSGILIEEAMYSSDGSITNESDNGNAKFESSMVHSGSISTGLLTGMSSTSKMRSRFHVLISGNPRGGQRHLAACILHCFVGNVEIQKIDLATVSQEGRGDMVQGLTRILMKCAQFQSCMIFMPRIDLWAVETCHQVTDHNAFSVNHPLPHEKQTWSTKGQANENESYSLHSCKTAELEGHQGLTGNASLIWNSLVEQMESICVSTSLMIMATSELPYQELPSGIRQFFKNDFSNGAQSTCLVDMLPRFALHIDQGFNHDEVIRISATELLRNTVKSFIQLVHQRAHLQASSSKDYEICDIFKGYYDAEDRNHGLIGENKDWKQCPLDPSKLPPPSSNRNLKGKSSIVLAISTFGYQILRYPHFAELCWVTSKLKEGPCADVSGPWKGWPFNSCIIRPTSSLDKHAVCAPISLKSRERSGLVRGLIAVGLLAYRGVYRSLKEVSLEVRKVLELLVGQVNEKIHTGKDKNLYVRLLSQVAYLEDVVNCWAYALQSFDRDDQMQVSDAKPNTVGLPNTNSPGDKSGQSEGKENTCNEFYNESGQFEVDPRESAYENNENVEPSKGENGLCTPNSEGGGASLSEDGPTQHITPCDHSNGDRHPWNSIADNLLAVNVPNHENGTTLDAEVDENPAIAGGNSMSLKHSNGFSLSEPVNTCELGPSCTEDFGVIKFSSPEKSCDQSNGLSEGDMRSNGAEPHCNEHVGEGIESCKSETNIISSDHHILCSYQCCSGCLNTLHSLIEKMLRREWGLNRNHWTVEDVHETVASLSVDILSAVRRIEIADDKNYSLDENLRNRHPEKLPNCGEGHECHCKSTGDKVVVAAEECDCHSKANNEFCDSGPSLRYVFRDGFMFSIDSEEDVSFHCKFETLCLCPVIDSVVMMKQPFD